MSHLWGIDLGGTKIELAVLQEENKTLVFKERCLTESEKGEEHIYSQIIQLIKTAEEKLKLSAPVIGIGTPGVIDPSTNLMKNSNTTCLNGRAIQTELEALSNHKFIFANDANCFAVAETLMGIVPQHFQDPKLVFGVILGTGVGGGLVINGKIHYGMHGISGEWGHNFLDESGGRCYCGKIGCVETIISGPALERYYKSEAGIKKTLKQISIDAKSSEDIAASKTIERLITYFGKSVAQIINILDPEAIVVGGGVGNIDQIYSDIEAAILPYLFNENLKTKILKPKLGDSAGVFGAALLTLNQ